MSQTNKKGHNKGWPWWIFILPVIDFILLLRYLLHGKNIAMLNPKGFIANEQLELMIFAVATMLVIAIPTFIILYRIAWRYRESNKAAVHSPSARASKKLVLGMWLIPITAVLILASVMWSATHRLSPQKTIVADAKPMTIQVVAMRWKWLFIYPEQHIATVNFVQIPTDTPVRFELTADEAPMSSFWIPNLGGQLYAMTGHVNPLNLKADTSGDYPGSSAEINGAGFAGMRFTARATDSANFDAWIQKVRQSPDVLDTTKYQNLLKPSENNPPTFYSGFESNLYDKVVTKYKGHTH